MRDATVYFDLADTSDPAFDRPVEILLIGLLAISPLALGAVQAWSEAIFIGLAFAMAATLALKLLFRPDVQFVRSWTFWPIGLFVALVALQLVPLPAGLVRVISPNTFLKKQELLSDLPGAAERLRWMTLSFYPEATRHDLRLLLAVICVFVVVLNCIRRVSQIRRVLGAIAIIAGAFAVLALAQDAMGTKDIYWLIRMPSEMPARSGPFINHSHFGQFMNLSIGAAIGLALVMINQHFRRENYSPHELAEKLRSRAMRPVWLLLAMIVLSAGAVLLSLSRGAMLGAGIAGFVVGAVLVTRPRMRGRGWILAGIVLCVTMVVLLDYNRLLGRLMESGERAHGNRMEILRDIRHQWKEFPLLGSGLGTFSVIFPMYDRSAFTMFASHAENEYAQLLTETGGVGVALAVAFWSIIAGAAVRAARGGMSPASSLTIGLMFGLLAILIHSFTDFGQHIPAVAALTAVTCALVLNLAQLRWRELGRVSTSLPSRGSLIGRIGATVAIVGIAIWVGFACASTMTADRAWQVVRRMDANLKGKNWDASSAEYTDIIETTKLAADARRGDIRYHYWLNFYRWKAITGRPVIDAASYFPRIIDELHAGRWICPTHGPTYLLASRLEAELPDRAAQAAIDLERAYKLSGPDPDATFLWGQLEARQGMVDRAMIELRRAAELDRSLIPAVIDVCVTDLKRPELALQLAGDDIDALNILAVVLAKDPGTQPLAEQARDRAFVALQAKAQLPDASPAILVQTADALVVRQKYEDAIVLFRRALRENYGETNWRMKLAIALEKLGRNDEAIKEAERCLQRREMREARALIDRLSQRSDATRSP
ncbi:MAG: O-antigen ligase family protein [Anaerolineae bacterium]|nr:O-antigen ligase family protein [Phycisphaerae bacterium]